MFILRNCTPLDLSIKNKNIIYPKISILCALFCLQISTNNCFIFLWIISGSVYPMFGLYFKVLLETGIWKAGVPYRPMLDKA